MPLAFVFFKSASNKNSFSTHKPAAQIPEQTPRIGPEVPPQGKQPAALADTGLALAKAEKDHDNDQQQSDLPEPEAKHQLWTT